MEEGDEAECVCLPRPAGTRQPARKTDIEGRKEREGGRASPPRMVCSSWAWRISLPAPTGEFISQQAIIELFRKSQFLHKSINLFFISVIIKRKCTDW